MMKTVLVAAAASLTQTASAWCNADPENFIAFDPKRFSGVWHMQQSTHYGSDQSGCVTLSISSPNDSDKLDTAVRSVQLYGANPFQDGRAVVEQWKLDYDTYGNLGKKLLWVIPQKHYKVLDTDYDNYAVVYQCTSNWPKLLNIYNDDIHIFTRSESVGGGTMRMYKRKAEDKIAGSYDRFEDLQTEDCLAKPFAEKFIEFFSNPEWYFRKW